LYPSKIMTVCTIAEVLKILKKMDFKIHSSLVIYNSCVHETINKSFEYMSNQKFYLRICTFKVFKKLPLINMPLMIIKIKIILNTYYNNIHFSNILENIHIG